MIDIIVATLYAYGSFCLFVAAASFLEATKINHNNKSNGRPT